MPTEELEVDTPAGDVEAADAKAVDVLPDEPMGAQLLRRMHENALLLMEEYDSHLKLQDHPEIKKFAVECLEHIEDTLSTIEDMFAKEYPDGNPLESADTDGGEVEEATDTPEDLPTAEESVDGMGLNEKSFQGRRSKSYYSYGKKGSDKLRGKNKPGQIRAIWHEDPEGDYHPDAKALTEDEAAAIGDEITEQTEDVEEKSLICSKDMETLNGAAGFLSEAAEYQGDWGDEMRTKAGHWHKQVGPLGALQEELGTDQDEPVPGEMGQKAIGGVQVGDMVSHKGNQGTVVAKDAATETADVRFNNGHTVMDISWDDLTWEGGKSMTDDEDALRDEMDKQEKAMDALNSRLQALLK